MRARAAATAAGNIVTRSSASSRSGASGSRGVIGTIAREAREARARTRARARRANQKEAGLVRNGYGTKLQKQKEMANSKQHNKQPQQTLHINTRT
jgi:hypothetical protein